MTPSMREVLSEVREIRLDLLKRAEQMARVEKRLRAAVHAPADA